MKGSIRRGMVLVIMAVFLTGCGDEMFPLTEGEEAIIVNYSAGTLAKHNRRQQEGLTMVVPKEEEEEEAIPEPEEETKEEVKEEEQDTEETKDSSDDPAKTETEEEETVEQVTLTEALAISGMEFSYRDCSATGHYQQGEAYSLDAAAGNTYLMLNFNITNTGSDASDCDVIAKQPVFTLKVGDNPGVQNLFTLLENDLSTYSAAIEPGQTVAAVLLFEVPESVAENTSDLQLELQMNGNTSEIKMK